MSDLPTRVRDALAGGPLARAVIETRLGNATPDEINDALWHLVGKGIIERKGLRYFLVAQPEPAPAPAHSWTRSTGKEKPIHVVEITTEGSDMESKACKKCGVTKPLDEFPKNPGCKDGHTYSCKACVAAGDKKRRKAQTSAPAAKTGGGAKVAKTKKPPRAKKAKRSKPAAGGVPAELLVPPEIAAEISEVLAKLLKLTEKVARIRILDEIRRLGIA